MIKDFITFEVAIGRNGKIWLDTKHQKNLIILFNLIKKANGLNESEIKKFV